MGLSLPVYRSMPNHLVYFVCMHGLQGIVFDIGEVEMWSTLGCLGHISHSPTHRQGPPPSSPDARMLEAL